MERVKVPSIDKYSGLLNPKPQGFMNALIAQRVGLMGFQAGLQKGETL